MSAFIRTTAGVFAVLSGVACASAPGAASSSERGATSSSPRAEKSSSTVIVAADLKATSAPNLYDAIQAIHPEWFRRPGAVPIKNSQSYGIAIYVDNQRAGDIDILRQTNVSNAASVRYYSPSEAQMRFGNGNMNGVIQVVTTTGKPDR